MALAVAAAAMLAGGQALALGCSDIPGATVDPALDASATNQNYGRLFPEFKSRQQTGQARRALTIDRLVGKQLRLKDGKGYVWLTPSANRSTKITAVLGDRTTKHTVQSRLAGLDNVASNGKLLRTFFSLGIAWSDFVPPSLPAVGPEQVPAKPGIARIARTTIELKGMPSVIRDQSVEYACSNEASFVGDPAKLSSMVVLKGTIRARQLTITVTTEKILDLTINDVVEQRTASHEELMALLGGYPEIAEALKQVQDPVSAETPETALAEQAEQQSSAEVPAIPAAPAAQVDGSIPPPANPSPDDGIGWTVIFSVLAVLCAINLLYLFHPYFTARRQRDSIPAAAVGPPELEIASAMSELEAQAAPIESEPEQNKAGATSEPEPKVDVAVSQPEPEATASAKKQAERPASSAPEAPDKSVETRIAVLDDLRAETETFQKKLQEAIAKAASEAEDSKVIKGKLAEAESQLEKVTAAKLELRERGHNDRTRLNAAQEESRQLKELVVDLKTRLAKANAQIESSESVIVELESASRMAIELNADYRSKTHDFHAENRAMRSRIGLLETSLAERDDLLKSTNQTNEEISKALLDERLERASIEDDFSELSKDFEALQQKSSSSLKRVNVDATQAEYELRATREIVATLEREMKKANDEHKQMQLDHHAKQTENARMRVEHGMRTRLLENNLHELSAHVEVLEQRLRASNLEVPALQLTPVEGLEIKTDKTPKQKGDAPARANRDGKHGDVLRFRAKR